MKNADMPAMPQTGHTNAMGDTYVSEDNGGSGLSKREFFAAMAMQGLIAGGGTDPGMTASSALKYADALLVRLEHTKEPTQ